MKYLITAPHKLSPRMYWGDSESSIDGQIEEDGINLDDMHNVYRANGYEGLKALLEHAKRHRPHQWVKLVVLIEKELERINEG